MRMGDGATGERLVNQPFAGLFCDLDVTSAHALRLYAMRVYAQLGYQGWFVISEWAELAPIENLAIWAALKSKFGE